MTEPNQEALYHSGQDGVASLHRGKGQVAEQRSTQQLCFRAVEADKPERSIAVRQAAAGQTD